MNRLDTTSTALQLPLEGQSGPSLDRRPDSDLQTRPENPDSNALTLTIDEPCTLTIQTRPAPKEKIQTRPPILAYDEAARLEGVNRKTFFYRAKAGKLTRVEMGIGRNGKPIWGIPLTALSPAAYQRWESEHLATHSDSTADLTGDGGRGLAARMGNGEPSRQALSPLHHEDHVGGASLPRVPSAVREIGGGDEQHLSPALPPAPAPLPTADCRLPSALSDSRGGAVARFNADGIPVIKGQPRLVWEAGLAATWSPHAVEEFNRRRRAVLALEVAQAGLGHGAKLDAARRVAHAQRLDSYRTLLTWQRRYRRHGEPGLVPHWKKATGSKTLPKRLQAELEAFYAQGGGHNELDRPTVAQCYRYSCEWWLARYRPGSGHLIPSYDAVNRHIQSVLARRPMLVESARNGKDHFRDTFEFHVRRDPEAMPLGACYVLDHRVMDTHVIAPSGRICRPWLTAIVDIHSADYVGWVLREQVSSDGVASAFRRAILGFNVLNDATGEWIAFPAHGVCQHAYLDHGKEFHGGAMKDVGGASVPRVQARGAIYHKHFSPKDLPLDPAVAETLFSGLGIHRVTAIRFSARSKPIEPIFGSFATRIENLIAGHCGRNTIDKPEQLLERKKRGELLSWVQYLGILASSINDWRHERPIGFDRDKPPAEYWDGWQGDLPDPARLDTLMLRKLAKRVRNCGIEIEHGGERYHYASDDPEFAIMSGAEITVLWTPDDTAWAVAVHPVSGRRILLPRVDLRDGSWNLMFGLEMPAEHKIIKRAVTVQKSMRAAYRQWGAGQRSVALADPTGSQRLAEANGRELRGLARDIRRDSAPSPLPTADCPLPTGSRPYRREVNALAADPLAEIEAYTRNLESGATHERTLDQ